MVQMQVHQVEHPAHAGKVLVVLPGFVVDRGAGFWSADITFWITCTAAQPLCQVDPCVRLPELKTCATICCNIPDVISY